MSGNVTAHTTKRTPKRNITGAKYWQINSHDGRLYYNREERPPNENQTVDFGTRYCGEVQPAYADGSSDRFVDEIVAWEFHGPPPLPWRYVTVAHLDGDPANHAPNNLRWDTDTEWLEANNAAIFQKLMKSGIPAAGQRGDHGDVRGTGTFPFAPIHGQKIPRIANCPDWADVVPTWVRPPEQRLEPAIWLLDNTTDERKAA